MRSIRLTLRCKQQVAPMNRKPPHVGFGRLDHRSDWRRLERRFDIALQLRIHRLGIHRYDPRALGFRAE